ncbi:MAG: hypothetical protein ACOCXM_05775 [Myxococcota bacterium]
MQHPPAHEDRVVRLETGLSIDDTLARLERVLAGTPWRLAARVDRKIGTGPDAEPVHVLLVAPRGTPANGAQDLTWSLLLTHEIVVYRERSGRVAVAYHRSGHADGNGAAPDDQLAAWHLCLAAAVALATTDGAPELRHGTRPPAPATTQLAAGE